MEKPYVVEVRSYDTYLWCAETSDQRPFFLPKRKYPDELAAYMAVTKILEEQDNDRTVP